MMNTTEHTTEQSPKAFPGSMAGRVPVAAIMSRHVVSVDPSAYATDVARLLLEQSISGVPVVDGAGRPVGILSKTDLLAACLERDLGRREHPTRLTAGELMRPLTFILPQNESISRAAALMAFEGVHRVPVVGVRGQLVGLVSALDVARWVAREDGFVLATPVRAGAASSRPEGEPK